MKRWMTGMIMALGGMLPSLGSAQGPWDAPGAQQAGFHQQALSGPSNPFSWHNNCPPDFAGYEQLLPDRGILYDHDSRLDLTLGEALSRSSIRLDYLLWDISDGGNTLLGAPVTSNADLTGQDATNRLPAVDPVTGPRPLTSAVVPRLGSSGSNLNGLRGTIFIPTPLGVFDADVWKLEKSSQAIRLAPFVDSQIPGLGETLIGATTLLNNGVPSNSTMILFSDSYLARMQTTLLGTEANWAFNPFTPNIPVEVSPILGFRYVRLEDRLSITGTDVSTTGTVLNHEITSAARNNVFGPQVGLRFTTRPNRRLDLGADAKILVGVNKIYESVHTEQIFSPTEAPQTDKDTRTRFGPIFDLSLYGKLHLTERFSLYVGYDLMVGGGFSRAYNNINYDSPANITDPPAIGLDPHLDEFVAQGLAVGGELTFR